MGSMDNDSMLGLTPHQSVKLGEVGNGQSNMARRGIEKIDEEHPWEQKSDGGVPENDNLNDRMHSGRP